LRVFLGWAGLLVFGLISGFLRGAWPVFPFQPGEWPWINSRFSGFFFRLQAVFSVVSRNFWLAGVISGCTAD
jgi:hypothetical protein